MRIEAQDTCCIAIDYQEKIIPAMYRKDVLLKNSVTLLRGLAALEVPMLLTTQYAKGLGRNVAEIQEAMNGPEELDKTTFSVYETPAIAEAVCGTGKKNVLLCGIEAHICVLQSAIDLKAAGFAPVIVADCVSSRTEEDIRLGLKRAEQEGILLTSKEAVLFELTRRAGGDVFRQISALIK